MKKNNIIEIKNLKTSFDTKNGEFIVHKNISLEIKEGETLAIIGANGAGKTVLVETIVNIHQPKEGEINFKKGFSRFKDIGIQFQTEDNINETIKPSSLITFYKDLYGDKVKEEQLDEMINVFGIKDLLNQKMSKLSGGQKQRVNLLLAAISNPKLLILDEFTTGLDIVAVIEILDYITKKQKENKSSTIIISHNAKEIKELADRVIGIKNGEIVLEMTASQIREKYKEDFDQLLIDVVKGSVK